MLAVGREPGVLVVLAAGPERVVAGQPGEVDGLPGAAATADAAELVDDLLPWAVEGKGGGEDRGQDGQARQQQDQRPDARALDRRSRWALAAARRDDDRLIAGPGPVVRLGERSLQLGGEGVH